MRRLTVILLAVLFLACCVVPDALGAKTVMEGSLGEHITYTLDESGLLTVSGYGEMDDLCGCDYTFARNVKEVVIGEGITGIGTWVFKQCSMEKLTLPSTVTSIRDGAFYNCSKLKKLTLPAGLRSIGFEAFLLCETIQSVSLPSGLKSIGPEAFRLCSGLQAVSIPASVTSIGYGAFSFCGKLASIQVDSANTAYKSVNGVLFDKSGACLYQYPAGKEGAAYEIPAGVTTILNSAFYGNPFLASVTVPEGVRTIYAEAFRKCTSLNEVSLPASVSTMKDDVFTGCEKLQSVSVADGNTNYASAGGVLFSKGFDKLLLYPAGKPGTSYTIPDGVQTVCKSAFAYSLPEQVRIPESVTAIEQEAFSYCRLTSVSLPGKLKTIGDEAFFCNTSLKSVTIPDSVTSVGKYAFQGCKKLEKAVLSKGMGQIAWCTFYACEGLKEIFLPLSVTTVNGSAFACCDSLKTVRYAGTKADRKKIRIADSNEKLTGAEWKYKSEPSAPDGTGDSGGSGDSGDSVSEVTVSGAKIRLDPDTKTASVIGAENDDVRTVVIPATVTASDGTKYPVVSVSPNAFKNKSRLQKVTIGKNVRKIGSYAFSGCGKLKNIIVKTARLAASSVGKGAFRNIHPKVTFKCPKKQRKAYRKIFRKKGAPATAAYK